MKSFFYKVLGERYIKTKIVFILFLLMNVAWVRSYYTCDLTGRRKIVDRVFFMPVQTLKQETEVSRWLDAHLGPTKYRIWVGGAFDNLIGGTTVAFKSRPQSVYEAYTKLSLSQEQKTKMLEALREARQTVPKDSRYGTFEFEETE